MAVDLSPSNRPRVLIVDDHVPTRADVRVALEEDGFVVSAEEETGPAAVAAALRDPPDLCLLGVEVPGGMEAAAAIRSRLSETQVVILSASDSDDELFDALQAGASGFLPKGMDPSRLGPTLVGVLRGEAALPRELTARLIREFRARGRRESAGLVRRGKNELTQREWDVLDCLCEGLSSRAIAQRLFITQTTVRRHVGSILVKLGVSSRQAAVDLVAKRSRNLNAE